ncbi:hypothetical protein [Candidatus Amarobacter glycogenicus]|uniref:hypothetical protein n=1 Tax=Candidatus Amarobacter glycogenicus TaxID=3140699 RepID=UPI0031CC6433
MPARWNYRAFIEDGLFDPLSTVVLAYTEPYDHCNMTAGPAAAAASVARLRQLLLKWTPPTRRWVSCFSSRA